MLIRFTDTPSVSAYIRDHRDIARNAGHLSAVQTLDLVYLVQMTPQQAAFYVAPSCETIPWDKAEFLDAGGYAAVFQVVPGIVAKVGEIRGDELDAQRWTHEQGYPVLPVLDEGEMKTIPYQITESVCPVHGPRSDIMASDEDDCCCGEQQDILLMPEAECPDSAVDDLVEVQDLQTTMQDVLWEELGHPLDVRPANIMKHAGRFVVIDFGVEK